MNEMHRYAFDVDPDSQTFLNRRVFAYVDTGIPDGVQIDKNGNVYAGCGDGVQVRVSFFIYLSFGAFFIFDYLPGPLSSYHGGFFVTHFNFFIIRSLHYSVI